MTLCSLRDVAVSILILKTWDLKTYTWQYMLKATCV